MVKSGFTSSSFSSIFTGLRVVNIVNKDSKYFQALNIFLKKVLTVPEGADCWWSKRRPVKIISLSHHRRGSLSLTFLTRPVQNETAPAKVVGGGVEVLQDGVLVVQVRWELFHVQSCCEVGHSFFHWRRPDGREGGGKGGGGNVFASPPRSLQRCLVLLLKGDPIALLHSSGQSWMSLASLLRLNWGGSGSQCQE